MMRIGIIALVAGACAAACGSGGGATVATVEPTGAGAVAVAVPGIVPEDEAAEVEGEDGEEAVVHGPQPEVDPRLPGFWGIVRGGPRRIAGVVMTGGRPVKSRVTLRGPLSAIGAVAPIDVETGEDGRFDLGEVPIATWELVAQRDGFAATIVGLDLGNAEPVDALELALLPCHRKIHGTVTGDGQPLEGALVHRDTWAAARVATDASGAYEVCSPDGEVTLWVEAAGRGVAQESLEVQGTMQHDFEMPVAGSLFGRITDERERPAPGVLVLAVLESYGEELPRIVHAVTDAKGRYTIDGLAEGEYSMVAQRVPPAGDLAIVGGWAEVATGYAGENDYQLERAVRVAGRVELDGQALAGATVRWSTSYGDNLIAITRVDGSFEFWGVTEEYVDWEDSLTIDGYTVESTVSAAFGHMPEHEALRVTASSAGVVRGRVVHRGKGVVRAEVCLDSSDCITTTRTDGLFEVTTDYFPGELIARSRTLDAFGRIDMTGVDVDSMPSAIQIDLTDTSSVRGIVVDSHGSPVADALVTFENASETDFGAGSTGPDGRFYAPRMAGGTEAYNVTVYTTTSRDEIFPPAKGTTFKPVVIKDATTQIKNLKLVVKLTPEPAP